MKCPNIAVTRDPPEGKVQILGRCLLVLSVAYHHVRALPPEPSHNPFEATLLTCN